MRLEIIVDVPEGTETGDVDYFVRRALSEQGLAGVRVVMVRRPQQETLSEVVEKSLRKV